MSGLLTPVKAATANASQDEQLVLIFDVNSNNHFGSIYSKVDRVVEFHQTAPFTDFSSQEPTIGASVVREWEVPVVVSEAADDLRAKNLVNAHFEKEKSSRKTTFQFDAVPVVQLFGQNLSKA